MEFVLRRFRTIGVTAPNPHRPAPTSDSGGSNIIRETNIPTNERHVRDMAT